MKKNNKRSILVSSAIIAGLILTVSSQQVHASTSTNNENSDESTVLQINNNHTAIPTKASISPVASRDNQTLRQVAEANNTSLDILEKLNNNINPDTPIQDGTPLYLPQNSSIYSQENDAVPHSLYVKYWRHLSHANRAAKAWIAQRESGGSYTARNGNAYGRYQLLLSYLHGDLSKTNQERVANRYVKSRYGSWVNAKEILVSSSLVLIFI